ncbi:MAG: hypothetical protein P3B98_10555 [Gemmatimonadota bacterium]|nr:hypothetical protein [Gemmatimonadota bacterium]
MNLTFTLLRSATLVAAELARLDELVARSTPGLATLLMLRSAQTIVAANDRPLSGTGSPAGSEAFAALLGWWYAPEGREFLADDPHLRAVARTLDAGARRVREATGLTAGLSAGMLDGVMDAMALDASPVDDLMDATLSVAARESWPAVLTAAELSTGACGSLRAMGASLARALALVGDGTLTQPFLVAPPREDLEGALRAIGEESQAMRRRVAAYDASRASALARVGGFGRGAASAEALVTRLMERPATTVAGAAAALALSTPTAGAAVERLAGIGLLREITGRGRDRVFVYTPAVALAA